MKATRSVLLLLSLVGVVSLSPVAAADGCADMCPFDFAPVCGTNGVQYGNPCQLEIVRCNNPSLQLSVGYEGECVTPPAASTPRPASASCPTLCTTNPYRQCGSDGKTYTNACTFALAQCKDPSLQYQSQGPCPK